MKKMNRILSIVISLTLLLSSIYVGGIISVSAETVELWDGSIAEEYADGEGSETSPYIISTPAQLARAVDQFGEDGAHFKLNNDIYLNNVGDEDWYQATSNNTWFIGVDNKGYNNSSGTKGVFHGTVDGNGYSVYGVWYPDDTKSVYTGLFPVIGNSTIKNLAIKNSYFISTDSTGAFSGVTEATATGTVTFNCCYVDKDVIIKTTKTNGAIAGFVGYARTENAVIIQNCYNIMPEGNFSGPNTNNYYKINGFLGQTWNTYFKIIDSYSVITPINCSWTTSQANRYSKYSSDEAYQNIYAGAGEAKHNEKYTVLTAEQMQGEAAETNMPNLDFDAVFMTTDGYPMLRVFNKEAKKYTVNYHITETEVTQLQVTDDVIFAALEKPTRDGYKFLGFFTDAEFNNAAADNALVYQYSDIYAKWLETPYDAAIWNGAEKEPTADADDDGYIDITYPSQLAWVVANDGNNGGKYELLNDIYLNDITVDAENGAYTNKADTEPLQWYTKADGTFKGTLYGNGYIVYGLFYDNASETTLAAGLVPSANTLTISGVGVENSYIVQNTAYRVGAVIGTVHSATKAEIASCYAGENVYIKGTSVGGICGGGAPANTQDSVIISNCYSHAKLNGTTHTGGIFGNIWSTGKRFNITDCYVVGDKIYSGSISASNLSAWADNYATVSQNGGAASTVLSSDDMKGITAETSMSGLDFENTYVITDSYPRLRIFHAGLQSGENLLSAVKLSGVSLRIADINGETVDNSSAGLRFYASVDTTAGKYRPATDENVEYGILFETKEKLGGAELTIDTVNCARVKADTLIGEGEILSYSAELLYLSKENLDADFVVRGYMINGDEITYTEPQDYCAAVIADEVYEDSDDEGVKERIDIIFAESERFVGAEAEILTFSLFSDFHYKEGMYLTSIADMQSILDNANANNVDFIIHGGDFCNDYSGSPELMNTYLNNNHGLSAYGIYGNHELETAGNSMAVVTPLLTNRADNVVWGTSDGKIGDGSVGYYYFDNGNFRIVCTDTNYSYNPDTGEWEHYPTNSYGAPSGNTYAHSMGPVQLKWLETVLTDAAQSGKQCIVMGHATFNTAWSGYSPDAEAVIAIYNKVNNIKKGTVIMSLNGHYHTNRMMVADNVLFFDVNTTRNGYWKSGSTEHYTDEQTFQYVKYDTEGNVASTTTASLTTLSQSANTWFFENPLSAIVKISATGKITIDGVQSDWIYDVTPGDVPEYVTPEISDNTFNLWY